MFDAAGDVGASAVLCIDRVPTVCLVDPARLAGSDQTQADQIRRFCERLWNQNLARIVLIAADEESKPPLQKRTEPQLTQALAVHLRERQSAGEQPFVGDFYGELSEYVLDKATGLLKYIARTDIEWRLHGVFGFIIEFKILDGKLERREKYLRDGVMRFVVGRYSGLANAGAMFALLRKSASDDPSLLLLELKKNGADLQCAGIKKDSELLPKWRHSIRRTNGRHHMSRRFNWRTCSFGCQGKIESLLA